MDICNTIKTDFNKTCELCLKLIDDISNCEVSDESVNDKIEVLFIKLEVNRTEETYICTNCAKNLRAAFDFKTTCIETEDMLVPEMSGKGLKELNLRKIFCINNKLGSDEKDSLKICRLCRDLKNDKDVVPFAKFLENSVFLGVFEKHIPELNLNVVKDANICQSCQETFESISNFLIKFNKGAHFGDCNLPTTMRSSKKDKEVTKPNVSYQRVLLNGKYVYVPTNASLVKVELEYEVDMEMSDAVESVSSDEEKLDVPFKCSACSFVTKYHGAFYKHKKLHKKLTENQQIELFKCQSCSYETITIRALRQHLKIHGRNIVYKCANCEYRTLKKSHYNRHMRGHQTKKMWVL